MIWLGLYNQGDPERVDFRVLSGCRILYAGDYAGHEILCQRTDRRYDAITSTLVLAS